MLHTYELYPQIQGLEAYYNFLTIDLAVVCLARALSCKSSTVASLCLALGSSRTSRPIIEGFPSGGGIYRQAIEREVITCQIFIYLLYFLFSSTLL